MKEDVYYVFDNHFQFSPVYAEHVAVREDKIFFYNGGAPTDCSSANIVKSIPRNWGFFPASLREGHNHGTKTELLLAELNGHNYLRLVFPEVLYAVVDGYSLMAANGKVGFIPSWVAWDRHENTGGEEINRERVKVDTNETIKRS